MAKVKRISVNAFEKVMRETYTPITEFNWNGLDVSVKRTLSLQEMLEFVDTVVQTCFTSDTNRYIPEVKDFVIRTQVLTKYANFTMPSSTKLQYDFVYCTNIFDEVIQCVNSDQYTNIIHSIDDRLKYMSEANIEFINREINTLYDNLSNIDAQMSELFAGIDRDIITQLIDAISEHGLDEGKLVSAYFDKKKEAEGAPEGITEENIEGE